MRMHNESLLPHLRGWFVQSEENGSVVVTRTSRTCPVPRRAYASHIGNLLAYYQCKKLNKKKHVKTINH